MCKWNDFDTKEIWTTVFDDIDTQKTENMYKEYLMAKLAALLNLLKAGVLTPKWITLYCRYEVTNYCN